MAAQEKYVLRKHASISAVAAEEDAKFLPECFVDTGDIEVFRDCSERR